MRRSPEQRNNHALSNQDSEANGLLWLLLSGLLFILILLPVVS